MSARWRAVRTQEELDAVLADGDYAEISGSGYYEVSGSATVRAWGSATVSAWGSATVSASGSATVRASGSATVSASGYVAVHKLSMRTSITGGVVIVPPDQSDAAAWLDFHGIDVTKTGRAVLYKGVGDDFMSERGANYAPGQKPEAADWNPVDACGGGLHLSPRPEATHTYCNPKRYVACTVMAADIVPITDGAGQSDKCKVRRVLKCVEVDGFGRPVKAVKA